MIYQTLSKLELDGKEIDTYLKLLELGQARASTLAYQLVFPRSTAQNILLRLEKKGLVSKFMDAGTLIYTPLHPQQLEQLIQNQKSFKMAQYNTAIKDINEALPDLLKLAHSNKKIPNVRIYQGSEAVRKVLFDTLTCQNPRTEIKDFANIDAMFEHAQNINDEYVAAREKTKITKRSLLLDTPFARKVYETSGYSSRSHKGYKWIPQTPYPFALEMNIYEGKVSYITYVENDFTGVIIENDHIFQMHESMWNLMWDLLPPT